MRTPVPIPRRRPQPRSLRSLQSACERAGIRYAPHVWDAAVLPEVFMRLLVLCIDHEHVGSRAWWDTVLTPAPREGRVTTCRCGGRVLE